MQPTRKCRYPVYRPLSTKLKGGGIARFYAQRLHPQRHLGQSRLQATNFPISAAIGKTGQKSRRNRFCKKTCLPYVISPLNHSKANALQNDVCATCAFVFYCLFCREATADAFLKFLFEAPFVYRFSADCAGMPSPIGYMGWDVECGGNYSNREI